MAIQTIFLLDVTASGFATATGFDPGPEFGAPVLCPYPIPGPLSFADGRLEPSTKRAETWACREVLSYLADALPKSWPMTACRSPEGIARRREAASRLFAALPAIPGHPGGPDAGNAALVLMGLADVVVRGYALDEASATEVLSPLYEAHGLALPSFDAIRADGYTEGDVFGLPLDEVHARQVEQAAVASAAAATARARATELVEVDLSTLNAAVFSLVYGTRPPAFVLSVARELYSDARGALYRAPGLGVGLSFPGSPIAPGVTLLASDAVVRIPRGIAEGLQASHGTAGGDLVAFLHSLRRGTLDAGPIAIESFKTLRTSEGRRLRDAVAAHVNVTARRDGGAAVNTVIERAVRGGLLHPELAASLVFDALRARWIEAHPDVRRSDGASVVFEAGVATEVARLPWSVARETDPRCAADKPSKADVLQRAYAYARSGAVSPGELAAYFDGLAAPAIETASPGDAPGAATPLAKAVARCVLERTHLSGDEVAAALHSEGLVAASTVKGLSNEARAALADAMTTAGYVRKPYGQARASTWVRRGSL
jgi:hypothetical protein